MTMHKALHPRNYEDRLYVSRKKGGRGLTSIQDSVDASIQPLKNFVQIAWWKTDYPPPGIIQKTLASAQQK